MKIDIASVNPETHLAESINETNANNTKPQTPVLKPINFKTHVVNSSFSIKSPKVFQNQTIHDFYEMYLDAVENIGKVEAGLLKRAFDDYLEFVDCDYVRNISKSFCDNYPYESEMQISDTCVDIHKDHPVEVVSALSTEFYVLFKVLDKVWKNEVIKKKDIVFLTPCRVFLLHSVIKRKFGEDLDFG